MKWGVCCKKKWTFPQRSVHYVQYQYFFNFTFYLFGAAYAPNAPPAYGPDVSKALKFRQNIDILFRRHVAITSIQLPPYYTLEMCARKRRQNT